MNNYTDIKDDIREAQGKANEIVQIMNNIDSEKARLDEQRSQAVAELNAQQGVLRFLLDKMPEDERRTFIDELNASNASESPAPPAPVEESVQDDS